MEVTFHYILFDQDYNETCFVENEKQAHQLALKRKSCYAYSITQKPSPEEIDETQYNEPKICKKVIFGKVYTLEEIKLMERTEYLVKGMEELGMDKAIKTRTGEWLTWGDWECCPE